MESEEFRIRREQRLYLQKERKKQQRRTIIGLIAAAIILIGCGVLIFFVARGAGKPGESTEPSAQPTDEATQPTETTAAPDQTTVIHISAAGDVNVTDKVVRSGLSGVMYDDTILEALPSLVQYDFTAMFEDVIPLTAQADLMLLNFEGNLCGEPYGEKSAPQVFAETLANIGVDVVQLANSRAVSNGMQGLTTTLQSIRAAGLESVGAYATEAEFKRTGGYIIREINGIKIAIVAFTKGMDGMALPAGSEDCVNLLYEDYASTYQSVDRTKINRILRSIRNEKPDLTIAMLHWGSEHNDNISGTQKTIKNLMLEGGVDVIIGSHPHRVQEIEYDAEAGTLVAYSLGDFVSDGERAGTEYSIVLDLEITKNQTTGETKITGYSYTPIFTAYDEEGTVKVVRLEQAIAEYQDGHVGRVSSEVYDDMVYALQRVEARINPPKDTDEEE